MIRLEKFGKENYETLISGIDSEEALMQFAGPLFTFPLTDEQLDISLSDIKRIAFAIVSNDTNVSIGHSEIYISDNSIRIGRILISDKQQRGKGLCQEIMHLLLEFSFSHFDKPLVELNVFDWNTSAIRCYEKAGFTINPDKKLERKIKDKTWIAINMTITKDLYEQNKMKNYN